jgi:hypothetical protein
MFFSPYHREKRIWAGLYTWVVLPYIYKIVMINREFLARQLHGNIGIVTVNSACSFFWEVHRTIV